MLPGLGGGGESFPLQICIIQSGEAYIRHGLGVGAIAEEVADIDHGTAEAALLTAVL